MRSQPVRIIPASGLRIKFVIKLLHSEPCTYGLLKRPRVLVAAFQKQRRTWAPQLAYRSVRTNRKSSLADRQPGSRKIVVARKIRSSRCFKNRTIKIRPISQTADFTMPITVGLCNDGWISWCRSGVLCANKWSVYLGRVHNKVTPQPARVSQPGE